MDLKQGGVFSLAQSSRTHEHAKCSDQNWAEITRKRQSQLDSSKPRRSLFAVRTQPSQQPKQIALIRSAWQNKMKDEVFSFMWTTSWKWAGSLRFVYLVTLKKTNKQNTFFPHIYILLHVLLITTLMCVKSDFKSHINSDHSYKCNRCRTKDIFV